MSQSPDPPPMARSVNAPPPPPPMARSATGRPLPIPGPGAPLDYSGGIQGYDSVAWRVGSLLYTRNGAILPQRCVRCNSDQDVRMKAKQFTWCTPWLYLTLLAGWLLALIIILLMQKKATITFGMCAACRKKRMIASSIVFGIFCLMIVTIVGAIAKESAILGILIPIEFVGMIIYGVITLPILKPKRIEAAGEARFSGCGEQFLASLPQGT